MSGERYSLRTMIGGGSSDGANPGAVVDNVLEGVLPIVFLLEEGRLLFYPFL
jgi:hypothetical protein